MIRAVRHFLWYLEHHSNGGRGASRPTKAADVYWGGPPKKPKGRESAVRHASRRKPEDRHGPARS